MVFSGTREPILDGSAMELRKYNENKDYANLIALFQCEPSWSWFLSDQHRLRHKQSLRESITYVAYEREQIIGYSRSLEDIGTYIYVCELLVKKDFRGNSFGKQMLDAIAADYPEHEIFIMSDEDLYYQKIGYTRIGSIFKPTAS